MPVASLNGVATANTYTDALTVLFPRGRRSFSVHVSNAAVFYKLATLAPGDRGESWEAGEHQLVMSLSQFNSPAEEGFPDGTLFAGIQLRSAATGVPATVSVL